MPLIFENEDKNQIIRIHNSNICKYAFFLSDRLRRDLDKGWEIKV
ncbi:hypothetical protein [Dapis sp. BLCC M126]